MEAWESEATSPPETRRWSNRHYTPSFCRHFSIPRQLRKIVVSRNVPTPTHRGKLIGGMRHHERQQSNREHRRHMQVENAQETNADQDIAGGGEGAIPEGVAPARLCAEHDDPSR